MKLQNAIEFLTLYGWVILIIAIVFGALVGLGVFNPDTFAPKALPGGCYVTRPDGPHTSQFINLAGSCNSALPEYVALFKGSSKINMDEHIPSNTITVSFWFYPTTYNSMTQYYVFDAGPASGGGIYIDQDTAEADYWAVSMTFNGDTVVKTADFPANLDAWTFVSVSYDGSSVYYSVDGTENVVGSASGTPDWIGHNTILGETETGSDGFRGEISNVQIYNESLSAGDLSSLYKDGLGAVPIDLQYLVDWVPLNSNADDYSGNGYNGTSNNIAYDGYWWSTVNI